MAWTRLISTDVNTKAKILSTMDTMSTDIKGLLAKIDTLRKQKNLPDGIVDMLYDPLNSLVTNILVERVGINDNLV